MLSSEQGESTLGQHRYMHRIEALVDGIFAVAMTLLVIRSTA
jgi:uncharacterized membrane protein